MTSTYLIIALCGFAVGCSDDKPAPDSRVDATPDATTEPEIDVTPDATEPEIDATPDVPDDTADAVPTDTTPLTPEAALAATVAAFCPGYASAWCDAAFGSCQCNVAPGFPDRAGCERGFVARCERELASFLEPVQSGQAAYDPAAAPACIAAFQPLFAGCMPLPNDIYFMTCPVLAPPGGWATVLPGADEPCQGSCLPGLRCTSESVCKTPGAAGAACLGPIDCAPALVCSDAGTCVAPDFSDAGKACAGPDACGPDTNCLASMHKTCVAPVAGQACRYDEDCVSGEFCALGADPEAGVCTPLPGVDAACANGVACAAGLGCEMLTTTCKALPGRAEPCAAGVNGPILCGAELACVDGFCRSIPGLGDPCAMGPPHCAAGLGCAFGPEGSICSTPAGEGATCENDATCGAGLFCDYNVGACASELAVGEPCVNGNECGAGKCLPDETFTFRCAPTPALGEACFLDDCADGLRCRTPYVAGACVPEYFCNMLRF